MMIIHNCIGVTVFAFVICFLLPGCRCVDREPSPVAKVGTNEGSQSAKLIKRLQESEWRRSDADGVVLNSLLHRDSAIKARAALAVGRMGLVEGATKMVALLDDPAAIVRRQATFGLRLLTLDTPQIPKYAKIGAIALQAILTHLPKEKDFHTRLEMIRTLGWIGDDQTKQVLKPMLDSKEAHAVAIALGVLGRRGKAGFNDSELLLPLLGSKKQDVVFSAVWAIAKMGGSDNEEVLRKLKQVGERGPTEVKVWAIRGLWSRKPRSHLFWFLSRATDSNPWVKVEVFNALGRCGKRGAVKLTDVLNETWIGVAASHFRLTGPQLHPVLSGLKALWPNASVPTVRGFAKEIMELSNAAESTVKYGRKEAHSVDLVHCAAAMLMDLGFGRPEMTSVCGTAKSLDLTLRTRRAQVARLVGHMSRDAHWKLTLLRRYLNDPVPSVRVAAMEAVRKIDDKVVAIPVVGALEDKDPVVFGLAALAIQENPKFYLAQEIGPKIVGRLLGLNAMVESEVICEGLKALGAVRFKGAGPLVNTLATSPNFAVRNCAMEVFQKTFGTPAASGQGLSRGLPDMSVAKTLVEKPVAVLVTQKGEILIELHRKIAPVAVANFVRLAQRKAYQKTRFHRVIPNFVIQGGDPRGDGWGGPGYTIPCELSSLPFEDGSVGMAIGGRDTGGIQFFVTLGRQPHLDGRYTRFGRVIKGMDVVRSIQMGDEIKDLYVK